MTAELAAKAIHSADIHISLPGGEPKFAAWRYSPIL
jgi:hypothetical protein